ncbi:cilia- and flagella-associated protein 206 isoform X2 [Leucoraja erinacea]|uniref:cilia- and flagella-associated protein 206 isoform X2 n=1 Tax=Leucoraja erinaceus TaxID=7782 RepID=UPI0024572434|nr:cilia- and flagella-associated protein 206 isoform X2 [Leucoraja erinacea]
MDLSQAECVIKNIIREIAQECADRGHSISETLVAFMVKAVVLDPRYEFNVDRRLTKTDVNKLIMICVDRLLEADRPSLDTIKMQIYFDMNYTSRAEFLAEHRSVLESRLAPVCREITDCRARSREEFECLYRKIVSYVLLQSGLGSPTDIGVVREATAALQSVFPQTELGTFLVLTKRDKERQLNELNMIVTGIRLFNKNCKKGGEGIDDLPAILNEALPATKQNVDSELQATQQLVYHYTAIIERLEKSRQQCYETDGLHDKLKEALFNVRQHEIFLSIIMPHFICLSNLWSHFQDEMVLLSVFSNLLTNLDPYMGSHSQLFPEGVIGPLLEGTDVKSDAQRLSEVSDEKINPSDIKNREWIFPDNTLHCQQLIVQYRGFCAYTLSARHGLLLKGNPAIGILKYQEKYYTFSSKEAATAFAQKPDYYIAKAAEEAKQSPELIQLLELHQQFSTISPYSQPGKCKKAIAKCDSSTQTDTHILEPNIVRSYEWNEWELRRKAIQMANLRQKVTRYMQTTLSHMRRDNTSQVYLPKNKAVQTKRENSCNVPKPQVFYAGLRGGNVTEPTNVIKFNLTRAVDET